MINDEDTVLQWAASAGHRLRQAQLRIATAESCTGGLIAAALTEMPGSSDYFERGFVCYANQAKTEMLGVPVDLINQHGAVSEAVAGAMAEGALRYSRAQRTLAVTGLAGPSGGTAQKPVGTVCFAWAGHGVQTRCETLIFHGNRRQIRLQAAAHALRELTACLRK